MIENGNIRSASDPERRLDYARAIRRLLLKEEGSVIMTTAFYDPPTERQNKEYIGNISATYGFGAHVAEVEVDPDTGEVTLLGLWAAHDVGRAINPMTVEGQIEGDAVMGIGLALSEELPVATEDGAIMAPNLADYGLPTTLDAPRISVDLIETHDPLGPYGANGIGEGGLIPVPAAVADAVGIRPREFPLRPWKVHEWMVTGETSRIVKGGGHAGGDPAPHSGRGGGDPRRGARSLAPGRGDRPGDRPADRAGRGRASGGPDLHPRSGRNHRQPNDDLHRSDYHGPLHRDGPDGSATRTCPRRGGPCSRLRPDQEHGNAGRKPVPCDPVGRPTTGLDGAQRRGRDSRSGRRAPYPGVRTVHRTGHHLPLRSRGAGRRRVAASLRVVEGVVRDARIALGAVAPRPLLVGGINAQLAGRLLDHSSAVEADRMAARASSPITDARGAESYRRRVVEILVARALRIGAGDRTPQGGGTGPGQRPASGRGYTGQEPAMKLSFTLNGDPVSRHVDGGETLVDFPA